MDKKTMEYMKQRVIKFEKLEDEARTLNRMKESLEEKNIKYLEIGNWTAPVPQNSKSIFTDNILIAIGERLEQINKELGEI
ncbi:hypothetical protein FC976_08355 [Clostridium sporogenes]|uniref:hypothetical protein n=1 Tax=Clostridium sporogenes TaxID=1509 RepID=UPI0013D1357D|nr:hypothetical protein [Clostridium sporogenes]NFH47238.1 hypothetical protein [Clostridium sporogenes]